MPTAVITPEVTIAFPMEWYLPKQRRICVDLDGVVCEYDYPQMVKDFFGADITKLTISAYDIADILGVSNLEINRMFENKVWGQPAFIDRALDTLREWKLAGHEIIIFSNRVKYMGHEGLARWLIEWEIPFRGIDGGLGVYDVHIDDRPSKLMNTNSRLKLLFDQPWNKGCVNVEGKLERVYDWSEVRQKVSSL